MTTFLRDKAWRPTKLKENIARITVDLKTRQILSIRLYERNLRFKCKRCATFCCKLGGPSLTRKDVERIESVGYNASGFIKPVEKQYGYHPPMPSEIKSEKDGSCMFLNKNEKENAYECSIYDVRPVLCRLYPFDFEKINANSFLLKVIPCCKGLNNPNGELVNETFITKNLLGNVLQLMVDEK